MAHNTMICGLGQNAGKCVVRWSTGACLWSRSGQSSRQKGEISRWRRGQKHSPLYCCDQNAEVLGNAIYTWQFQLSLVPGTQVTHADRVLLILKLSHTQKKVLKKPIFSSGRILQVTSLELLHIPPHWVKQPPKTKRI